MTQLTASNPSLRLKDKCESSWHWRNGGVVESPCPGVADSDITIISEEGSTPYRLCSTCAYMMQFVPKWSVVKHPEDPI